MTATADAIREFRTRCDVPGVALCLFDRDGPGQAEGHGRLSLEQPGSAVTASTVFCACSVAKSLTATLVCDLAEDGVMDLDTPVDRYLPGLRLRDRADAAGVTAAHLLSNTAGFVPDRVDHGSAGRNTGDLETETLAEARRMPLLAAPGEIFGYSNTGIALAGCLAQRVTGVPFADLMRERVLRPLGMTRTGYDPVRALTFPFLQEHEPDETGRLRVIHEARAGARHEPTGLCFTTVTDLARFGALHLRRTSMAHQARIDVGVDIDLAYGLGMFTGHRGGVRWIGHEGFYRGISCKLLMVPRHGIGLVWVDSRGPELRAARYAAIDRILAELGIGTPDANPVPGDAGPIPGVYRRFGARPLTVRPDRATEDLVLDDGLRTMVMRRNGNAVWTAPATPDLRPPWMPHPDSRSVALTFRATESTTHLRLNGLPYARST